MNVLVDRHQADLLYSLQLLFEDRLGFDVYVPVGMEWWEERYWQFGSVFGDARLADQYLVVDAAYEDAGGHYVTVDQAHPDRPIRAVTLEQFRELGDWAFVCASVQENQHGFHRLAGEAGARYVCQVGNTAQQVDWALDPLALVSSEVPITGRGVRYHQEFDSEGLFGYWSSDKDCRRRIASFVNCLAATTCWGTLVAYRAALPEFEFRVHGIGGEDGNIHPVSAIAERMRLTGWGWHDKPQGDGFGHVIHNWAAIGRPLVGTAAFYKGRLAEPLWDDLVTCVDLGRRTLDENVRLIREISDDEDRFRRMCGAIRDRFCELVDYDQEEAEIRALLGL